MKKGSGCINKWIVSLLTFLIAIIAVKLNNILFKKFNKDKKIYLSFLCSAMQAIIIAFAIFFAGSQFETFKDISSSLITSSALIVAVLGFCLQEGVSNLVHGMIISFSRPFAIGDRLNLPNQNLTGIVESINLRHTVIRNVLTNTCVLVPNSLIDKEIIENSYYNKEDYNYAIDVSISRESDLELAKKIIANALSKHQSYSGDKNVYVWIRDINDNAVNLRVWARTKTIEENFVLCSDVRSQIADEFRKAGISQPFVKYKNS